MSELKKTLVNKQGLYPNVDSNQVLMEQPNNYPIQTPIVGSSKSQYEIDICAVCKPYLSQSLASQSVQLVILKYKAKSVMKLVRRLTFSHCFVWVASVAVCHIV